jgi:hypothetical protein
MKALNKVLKKFGKKEYVEVYKLIRLNKISGGVESPYQKHPIQAGWYTSNTNKKLATKDYVRIEKGIHCYLIEKEVVSWYKVQGGLRCIKVYAKVSDLIGAGGSNYNGAGQVHLVFKKIYIPRATLKKFRNYSFTDGKLLPDPQLLVGAPRRSIKNREKASAKR